MCFGVRDCPARQTSSLKEVPGHEKTARFVARTVLDTQGLRAAAQIGRKISEGSPPVKDLTKDLPKEMQEKFLFKFQ